MNTRFEKTVIINANPATVWNTLTNVKLVRQWMGDAEMKLEIETVWKISSPFIIRGFHHVKFENRGSILQYEPNRILQYTHLNSLSRLEDKPKNYSVISFELKPAKHQTILTLTIENFPTETIYRHLSFYWMGTIEKIKRITEQQGELVN